MLYTVVDVIDHSIMKESVLDLIDNMPSKDVGVNMSNLEDDYSDLGYDYSSHISKTNWQDGIFGEEWAQIWPHFLSPADQFQVVNSIKNNYPDRDWSKERLLRVGLINTSQSLGLNILGIIMRIAREKLEKKIHV